MHHYSIFELFSIGIGPSSSHTVGPMRAAHRFLEQIRHSPRLAEISGIRCECYGSLAATGHGHGTDTAIMLGLLGEEPHTVEPRSIPGKIARLHQQETLSVTEEKNVRFSPSRDLDPKDGFTAPAGSVPLQSRRCSPFRRKKWPGGSEDPPHLRRRTIPASWSPSSLFSG